MKKNIKITERAERAACLIICIPMLIILFLCFNESFMHTMELKQTEEAFEKIILHSDNFIVNFLICISMLIIVSEIINRTAKIPLKIQMAFMTSFTVILGCLWVYSSRLHPTEDSFLVSNAANMAAHNNYEFVSDWYFNDYPFQLGYVFFCEILMRIAGPDKPDLMYIQLINVLMLAVTYNALVIIIKTVTDSKRAASAAVLSFSFCLQPLLYSSFIYGVIPGLTFSVLALLFEILFFKEEKKIRFLYLFLSALFIGTAVTIKMNNNIFLIAIIITAVVSAVKKFRISSVIYIAAVILLSVTINSAVKTRYEKLGNTKLDPGVQIISYISMGLHYPDGSAGCTAAGWYDGYYTLGVYDECEHDIKKVKKESLNQIKERIGEFYSDPSECNDFFYEKTMSQWNEPTYSSIWLNRNRIYYNDGQGKTADYLCNEGSDALIKVMNVLQMFTYMGALASVFYAVRNKKDILFCTIPLVVLGGFMYHMLAEGKSQYILPYYIMLCGFSSYGIDILCSRIGSLTDKSKSSETLPEKSE